MKRLLLVSALALIADAAEADQLQFKIAVGGDNSYASFAEVRLLTEQNQQVFRGYTDRYGRINVPIGPGRYRAVVVISGQTKTKIVVLTGASRLRLVTLE
jgi:hypothetical protein